MMKRYFIPIFILLYTVSGFTQPDREQIKALKISFITERLNLSEKEAQEFWPIYNTYEKNTIQIKHKELKDIRREIKEKLNTLNDSQAKELLDRLTLAHDKLHKENEVLLTKLRKIIPAQKILMLKVAEDDFNRKLFEQYKRRRQEHRGKD